MKRIIHLVLVLFFGACQNEPAEKIIPPELVIKKYQEFIDQNNFEAAKKLSTPQGQLMIEELQASIPEELMDSTVLTTVFYAINCQIDAEVATCVCDLEDNYERYEALYKLVKIRGKWLVDAPEEEKSIDIEEIQEIIEEIVDSGYTN